MGTDTIQLIFTYILALIVVIGGGAMLWYTPDDNLQLVVAGFIGVVIQWAFGKEVAKQATRAAQSSAAGVVER